MAKQYKVTVAKRTATMRRAFDVKLTDKRWGVTDVQDR